MVEIHHPNQGFATTSESGYSIISMLSRKFVLPWATPGTTWTLFSTISVLIKI